MIGLENVVVFFIFRFELIFFVDVDIDGGYKFLLQVQVSQRLRELEIRGLVFYEFCLVEKCQVLVFWFIFYVAGGDGKKLCELRNFRGIIFMEYNLNDVFGWKGQGYIYNVE